MVFNLNLQKFSSSTRTDFTLQTTVKYLREFMMCSTFTPNCWCYNSNIKLIGKVYCPKTMCSGTLCVHKRTFQSIRTIQCGIFLLGNKQIRLSGCVGNGFKFSKKHKNQFKLLLEMSIVLRSIVQDENVSRSVDGKKRWQLLRMFSLQSLLLRFDYSFLGIKKQTNLKFGGYGTSPSVK